MHELHRLLPPLEGSGFTTARQPPIRLRPPNHCLCNQTKPEPATLQLDHSAHACPAAQAALTPGGFRVYNGTAVPDLTATPSGKVGTCNAYIPSASTLARFQYVVDFLASNGLYVVRTAS